MGVIKSMNTSISSTHVDYGAEHFEGIKLAADWIRDLESDNGRLHKESVIEKALMAAQLGSTNAQCFLFNCYQAYNPYYVFGVKKVPETNGLIDKSNPWPKFWAMLEGLRTRSMTGHTARDAIAEMSQQFDSVEWNQLCRRVLIKDLRCGITERTLNKILGKTQWAIPVFECQLATDSNKNVSKMKGEKRLEVKLDGVRVLALVTKTSVRLFSRNGKPFDNFPHIVDALESVRMSLRTVVIESYAGVVLDGEIMGASFQALMKQAQRKTNVDSTDMVYNVFDVIPLEDFERGYWNAQQYKRLEILEKLRPIFDNTNCINIMEGIDVNLDTCEGHNQLKRYANDAVVAGFEGIMIKDIGAPYECKRSSFWMKWKPVITVDLNIIGFEEGTGRNEGRLGAIICEGVEDGKTIKVNVGGGLTDENRDEYWLNKDSLMGHVVEVAADAVTQNQDGTYSLRFPRFVRFRGTEPGEKL
jgi:DNA ligase-1